MSLKYGDRIKLKNAGFLDFEIRQLANAKSNQYSGDSQEIDLTRPEWKRLIASRMRQVDDYKKKGFSQHKISQIIFSYYKGKIDTSIWGLIQFDYYKARGKKYRPDFDKKKRRFTAKYGKRYTGSKPYG